MRPPILALAIVSLAAHTSFAQDKLSPPSEQTTKSPADQPITATQATPDPDIAAFLKSLAGTYRFEPAADDKAHPALTLTLHAAPIALESIPDTALVEISRADAPATPFRVYILHPYRRQGLLRLRQFELPATLRDALAGCWAAPDALPKLEASLLTPSLDMPLSSTKATPTEYHAATDHPFPTTRDGAIEMTAALDLSSVSLRLTDAGFDADGKQIWKAGSTEPRRRAGAESTDRAATAVEFTRAAHAMNPARRDDSGVVIISIIPPAPDAPKLQSGGKVTFHYTSWLTSGTLVESSRITGRPATITVPSNILAGLNKGLAGIAKGERRRIIIPPTQAYADLGRGVIPPGATLLFDVECLSIDNTADTAPPSPNPMVNPHTGERLPTPPAPSSDPNAPIGTPPTNPNPETPRR